MKIFIFPILILTCIQSVGSELVCSIRGTVKSQNIETITLFKTTLGRLDTLSSVKPAANGTFSFTFNSAKSGFFTIKGDRWEHKLYLKPGDKANVTLNDTLLTLTGQNTKENVALYQWEKIIYRLNRMSIYYPPGNNFTYKQIFPEIEEVKKNGEAFLESLNTGNSEFDSLMKQTVPYDIDRAALMSIFTPRIEHPKMQNYPTRITELLHSPRYDNDEVLNQPYGTSLVGLVCMYRSLNNKVGPNQFVEQVALIGGVKSKVELIIDRASRFAYSYNDYDSLEVRFGNLFSDPNQVRRLDAIKNRLLPFKTGLPAYDFTYPDADGKMHSLSSYKGKVVLIDLWATWCGPCIMEFPYMQALEKQYHDKDFIVIGVSIDLKKDFEKWKRFLREDELSGIQLFAGGWTKITKDYKITKIPRYMLIDKKGNIVTTNAPRPSDPALQKYIDRELAK